MKESKNNNVLVVIPAYNESENILKTVASLGDRYDYIVINDASTDETRDILIRNDIPFLNLPINLGIGGCVQTGYRYAWENGYDIAIQFDGDGQHDAAYIEDLIRPIQSGEADMTIGSRFIEKKGFQSSRLRQFGISYFEKLIYLLSGKRIKDTTSGFRAVSRRVLRMFALDYPQDYPEPQTNIQIIQRGMKVLEVPVMMNAREFGESSITPLRSVYYMIKVSSAILLESLENRKLRKKGGKLS